MCRELARLRAALGEVGLNIVLPLGQAGLDRAGLDVRLDRLLPGAGGAVVVGDGGGAFFAGFEAQRSSADADDNPLDRYTVRTVERAAAQALAPEPFQVAFPFARAAPTGWLPFQHLGQVAGLPRPGPLGVQVHPRFGPWWGYRALIVVRQPLVEEPPLADVCDGCAAPCVRACPADALADRHLNIDRCAGHRLQDHCTDRCASRRACVAGPEHRYPDAQLAFHMAASLRSIRRYYAR
jgi:epoxyqueuosine reductase